MSYEITLDELETLALPDDVHPDQPIKISANELRHLLALIPAARELERTFGTYVVPPAGDAPHFEQPVHPND